MSALVTMSQTVGNLISGTTYRVRSRTAKVLVKAGQATKLGSRRISGDDHAGKG